MNKMKASSIALLALGAAAIALGTAFVLTIPKDAWSALTNAHTSRMQAFAAADAETDDDSVQSEGANFDRQGYYDAWRRYPGVFMRGYSRGRGRRSPGGLLFLSFAAGMGAGFIVSRRAKDADDAKEGK